MTATEATETTETTVNRASDPAQDPVEDSDAGGSDAGLSVEIIDPWARLPAMGQSVAAAYISVTNLGQTAVTLAGVESTFGRVELHETIAADDGVMSMRERTEGFQIDAGASLTMEPGGVHVMLFEVERDELLMVGEIPIDLDFGPAGLVAVMVEVRDAANTAHGDMAHGDMAHGDMANGDMAHGDMAHGSGRSGAPDVNALHALDDELHAGILDADRQRATVAEFRAAVIAVETLTAEQLAEMLDVLDRLDIELAVGDVSAAAAVAFEAHDLAHDYIGHH